MCSSTVKIYYLFVINASTTLGDNSSTKTLESPYHKGSPARRKHCDDDDKESNDMYISFLACPLLGKSVSDEERYDCHIDYKSHQHNKHTHGGVNVGIDCVFSIIWICGIQFNKV